MLRDADGLRPELSWLLIDFVGDFEGERVEDLELEWDFLGEGEGGGEERLFSLVLGSL